MLANPLILSLSKPIPFYRRGGKLNARMVGQVLANPFCVAQPSMPRILPGWQGREQLKDQLKCNGLKNSFQEQKSGIVLVD